MFIGILLTYWFEMEISFKGMSMNACFLFVFIIYVEQIISKTCHPLSQHAL
jgi:hypothetical protein